MARRRKRPSTKALLHAARQLGIDDDETLARVMRCSLETVRRYREGQELARVSFHLQTSWLLVDTARLVRTTEFLAFRATSAGPENDHSFF